MLVLQDIAGTLATEAAEDSAQVAKLRSALESVDHKRRKVHIIGWLLSCLAHLTFSIEELSCYRFHFYNLVYRRLGLWGYTCIVHAFPCNLCTN